MTLTRRSIVQGIGGVPLAACGTPTRTATLPDKQSFRFEGNFLNAAFTHPLPLRARDAGARFLDSRAHDVTRPWPRDNPRNDAVALFARLINADPADIAVVPSTMAGENLVVAATGVDERGGVVTDALHYHASLALYGELARRGVPLGVAATRANRIELDDLAAQIRPTTRLVSVSAVASETGFAHDIAALCDAAHAKGAYVYADIIQAAGAVPIDVKASGVDFCCAAAYKWLMGDFGVAFLYVRPDRLAGLKRTQIGWRQVKEHTTHALPLDPPGPVMGDWRLGENTASVFEVGTAGYTALAATAASLTYIHQLGVDAIVNHRRPLLHRLQEELPRHGFAPLTPLSDATPFVAFAYPAAAARFTEALASRGIKIQLGANRIRVSPSVYSDMNDIDQLIEVLSAHA